LGTTVKVVIYSVVLLSILSLSQRWLHITCLSYFVCYAFLLYAKFLKMTVMQHQVLRCVVFFFMFCSPYILVHPYSMNQQDALFTFNLFQ